MRGLTTGERALAQSVFGDLIDYAQVRLTPWLPGATAVTVGSTVHLPRNAPEDFATADLRLQAWLVHELTHVWQFQTRPMRTVASWVRVVATGGYGPGLPGYAYRHPFDWNRLNLEQQAVVVEHAFLLRSGAASTEPPLTLADYAGRTPFEALTRSV